MEAECVWFAHLLNTKPLWCELVLATGRNKSKQLNNGKNLKAESIFGEGNIEIKS